MPSNFEHETRRLLLNAPDYVSMLVANNYIECRVTDQDDVPSIAFTEYMEHSKRWRVTFRPIVAEMSDEGISALWRHEVGHIAFAHFNKVPCMPEDPMRSRIELMTVGDIQINYYLLDDREGLADIGKTAKQYYYETTGNNIEGPGYIDAETVLPSVGLAVQEYSYDIIHAYVHKDNDDKGEGQNWTTAACGGIVGDVSMAGEARGSAVGAVAASGEETEFSKSWGRQSSMANIRLNTADLPAWIAKLETFARSIVQTVLADKRSHTRPQEIYKAYGVHMPSQRPRWVYKQDQICFLVDTSGSMCSELKYVIPVVQYLNQHNITVRVIAGDTTVTMDELLAPGTKLPEGVKGGGGTEITPLFDQAYTYNPVSLVCFTDGYVPKWPSDTGIPVLWVGTQTEIPYGTKA